MRIFLRDDMLNAGWLGRIPPDRQAWLSQWQVHKNRLSGLFGCASCILKSHQLSFLNLKKKKKRRLPICHLINTLNAATATNVHSCLVQKQHCQMFWVLSPGKAMPFWSAFFKVLVKVTQKHKEAVTTSTKPPPKKKKKKDTLMFWNYLGHLFAFPLSTQYDNMAFSKDIHIPKHGPNDGAPPDISLHKTQRKIHWFWSSHTRTWIKDFNAWSHMIANDTKLCGETELIEGLAEIHTTFQHVLDLFSLYCF